MLRDRLMAGRLTLNQVILVRPQVPQELTFSFNFAKIILLCGKSIITIITIIITTQSRPEFILSFKYKSRLGSRFFGSNLPVKFWGSLMVKRHAVNVVSEGSIPSPRV